MPDSDKNVYYHPEKHGAIVVWSVDLSDGNWCFDLRVIWRRADGRLVTARDSGCSCPIPFEDYDGLKDMRRPNYREIEQELRKAFLDGNLTAEELSRKKAKLAKLRKGGN